MHNLPKSFRHIKLELAREKDHPRGDGEHGYDILAPLMPDGKIDSEIAKKNRTKCRVRRFRPNEPDAIGLLLNGPGGRWSIDYDDTRPDDDEAAFKFGDEHFTLGEYVSIKEDDGKMHTFKITLVQEL